MTQDYSQIRIRLHWLTLLLVSIQFLGQGAMVGTMDALRSGQSPSVTQFLLSNLHLLCGVMVLILTMYRLVLRLREPPPGSVTTSADWMTRLASAVHWMFYALLIAMPLSGLLAYYRIFEAARDVHVLCKWVLVGLLILHVGAAFAHLFYYRDGVWERMVQWRRRQPPGQGRS